MTNVGARVYAARVNSAPFLLAVAYVEGNLSKPCTWYFTNYGDYAPFLEWQRRYDRIGRSFIWFVTIESVRQRIKDCPEWTAMNDCLGTFLRYWGENQ
jgi:hypothetical protein